MQKPGSMKKSLAVNRIRTPTWKMKDMMDRSSSVPGGSGSEELRQEEDELPV